MLVGAGSVRRAEQFAQIADAGARFAVSPGATASLLDAAERQGMPFVPGAVTASEIIGLLESGYRLQKFFPAEASGGLASIRALAAPLPEVLFFPTGGIDQTLAREYLACECVASVGGSWFVPAGALAAGDFARIRELASDARTVAMQVRPLLTDG
jgi:2-dehydro-3-deoxyphosphogluconate aldolase/(4S)-4-hydroxy-2-oxoglutarate aldolase